ncbi:MAG: AarF/UbiB family protein, partial [Candidatus Binataceae bacterium]
MPTPKPDAKRLVRAPEPEPGPLVRAWRFVSVAWVAANIYAGYKSIQLWSRIAGDARKEERYRRQDGRAARALYRSAVRLQGMLIKACQFIATRADVLPDAWVDTLSGLHDHVPPRPFAAIRERVERELGRPLGAVFAEFDPRPLASASLAQVHAAR